MKPPFLASPLIMEFRVPQDAEKRMQFGRLERRDIPCIYRVVALPIAALLSCRVRCLRLQCLVHACGRFPCVAQGMIDNQHATGRSSSVCQQLSMFGRR